MVGRVTPEAGGTLVQARPRNPSGLLLIAAIITSVANPVAANPANSDNFGNFEGEVVAKWNEDGRTMTLVKPFAYVTTQGIRWEAPEGSVVDGASIPKFAWSIIGGPFEGKYRNASVVHDVACAVKKRPWQDVHEAFYTAMLAAGVEIPTAKIMYAAVYYFGPRWQRVVTEDNVPLNRADTRARAIAGTAQDGETAHITIQPNGRGSTGDLFGITGPPPDRAYVEVMFQPATGTLTAEAFEALKREIRARDLTLSEIRSFNGGTQK